LRERKGHHRCFEQTLHVDSLSGSIADSVIVAVLAGLRRAGGARRVASVISIQRVAWPAVSFHRTWRSNALNSAALAAESIPARRSPSSSGSSSSRAVSAAWGTTARRASSLGLSLSALVVEFGEPVGDPGPHRGGHVGAVGRELLQGQDLGLLRGVELLEPGFECGGLGVTVGDRVGASRGDLGGQRARRGGGLKTWSAKN
jgi:hypothetical protein